MTRKIYVKHAITHLASNNFKISSALHSYLGVGSHMIPTEWGLLRYPDGKNKKRDVSLTCDLSYPISIMFSTILLNSSPITSKDSALPTDLK